MVHWQAICQYFLWYFRISWCLLVTQEPADPTDPVYHYPNVIALPHAGAGSQEVFQAMADTTVDNIVRLKEGRTLLNRIV